MFDWMTQTIEAGGEPDLNTMLVRMALGMLGGFVVSWLYRRTRSGSGAPSLPATLVLMAVLIAGVTQVIGDNMARAFSLVGALSIVRFRTVVRDTRDTAFVIFAVVVGMAFGSGYPIVGGLSLVFTGIAAAVVRPRAADAVLDEMELTVRVALGHDLEALAGPVFHRFLRSREEVTAKMAQKGTAIELGWRVTLCKGVAGSELVRALSRIEGIQDVELHRVENDR